MTQQRDEVLKSVAPFVISKHQWSTSLRPIVGHSRRYWGGKNSVWEKLCPGEILTGKILSRPAGSGKYIDRREAPEIFEGILPIIGVFV